MLQKIFDQTVRFSDNNNEPFPGWEEKQLKEVLEISKKHAVRDIDKNKILTVKLHRKGVERSKNVHSLSVGATTYYSRRAGDLIYGKQNLFNGAMALLPDNLDGFLSSGDVPTLSIDCTKIDSKYLIEYIGRKNYYKKLERISSGSGSKRIHENTILEQRIMLPVLNEQQKITSLITTLNAKISTEENRVTTMKQWKKNLLKGMLV